MQLMEDNNSVFIEMGFHNPTYMMVFLATLFVVTSPITCSLYFLCMCRVYNYMQEQKENQEKANQKEQVKEEEESDPDFEKDDGFEDTQTKQVKKKNN